MFSNQASNMWCFKKIKNKKLVASLSMGWSLFELSSCSIGQWREGL